MSDDVEIYCECTNPGCAKHIKVPFRVAQDILFDGSRYIIIDGCQTPIPINEKVEETHIGYKIFRDAPPKAG